jgi:hypothetical protein
VGTSALILFGVGVVLSTTPWTYALWNQAEDVPESTVTTGTLSATIAVGTVPAASGTTVAIPTATLSGLLPGETRGVTLTIQNTGTTPLVVGASVDAASAGNANASFSLAPGVCPVAPAPGTPLTVTPAPVGQAMTPGQFAFYCLATTLSTTVPQAAQGTVVVPAFTILLDAQQEPL